MEVSRPGLIATQSVDVFCQIRIIEVMSWSVETGEDTVEDST